MLSGLAMTQRTRFEHTGNPRDLNEAIELGRRATADPAVRSHALSNLSGALHARFAGAPADLHEASHLASAFQLAGYPHVIGTLWNIDRRNRRRGRRNLLHRSHIGRRRRRSRHRQGPDGPARGDPIHTRHSPAPPPSGPPICPREPDRTWCAGSADGASTSRFRSRDRQRRSRFRRTYRSQRAGIGYSHVNAARLLSRYLCSPFSIP